MQQNQYLPPPNAPLNKTEIVVVDSNLGETRRLAHMTILHTIPLPSWYTVVQSNRLNSLSFTSLTFQVSFPSQKFNDFARSALIPTIVIPGSFLNALTTGTSVLHCKGCTSSSLYVYRTCMYPISVTIFMNIIIVSWFGERSKRKVCTYQR